MAWSLAHSWTSSSTSRKITLVSVKLLTRPSSISPFSIIKKLNQYGNSKVQVFISVPFKTTDYDPISKPDCLPLSCVQRYITDATRKENPQFLVSSGSVESLDRTSNASERVEIKRKIAIKHHSYSMSSSNRSNTPTGEYFFKK